MKNRFLYIVSFILISFFYRNLWNFSAFAFSDSVVIQQLQTGGAGTNSATQEFILLLNTSPTDVQVSGWCVRYSSASDATTGFSTCMNPPDSSTELWVKSGGHISFATQSFIDVNPGFVPDFLMAGGMAAAGGHVRLMNGTTEIDKVGWGTATNPETQAAVVHTTGLVLGRDIGLAVIDSDNNALDFASRSIEPAIESGLFELAVTVDVCPNLSDVQEQIPEGYLLDGGGACQIDYCLNIDGLQLTLPEGYMLNDGLDCVTIPLEDRVIYITELFPNAPSIDTGQEFIELYNPNSEPVSLVGYRLQVGPSYTREYVFTVGTIMPGEYLVFYDSDTHIVLPNSTGISLRLIAPAGQTVSDSAVYFNAEDDVSWSLVDDVWIFTNQITPGTANKPFIQPVLDDEEVSVTTIFAPCPVGKYRNPLTNRCRALESAVSVLAPCDEDEFRNPETNRCKALVSTASTLTPCDADEVRNPATNRCRKIAASATSLVPCAEGQERNPETNRCRKAQTLGVSSDSELAHIQDAVAAADTQGNLNWALMIGVVGGLGGYALYEWRHELRQRIRLFKKR